MKRILLVTALAGAVALIPLAAQAQHGGGGHAGVAASHAGSSFARGTGSVGMRGAAVRSNAFIPGQRAFFPNSRFVFNNRFRFRNRFFFNSCFDRFGSFGGFGCSGAFLSGGYPYYDPLLYDYYGYGQQQQQQPVVVENNDNNDRELAFEMQAMRDEMQAMREEEHVREEARNNPPPRPAAQQDDGNATLVFRDGHQLSVRNYAVTDHTIWVLGPDKARKVLVSELDIPATEQINAKNGVEFHLPH
jgi:hypothetical protein